jgi:hypothetical protein
LAKEEAERGKTSSDYWSRIGYMGILPNLGIQTLNLTPEKRSSCSLRKICLKQWRW